MKIQGVQIQRVQISGSLARRRHDCCRLHLKEDFGTSSEAADSRIFLLPLWKQRIPSATELLCSGLVMQQTRDETNLLCNRLGVMPAAGTGTDQNTMPIRIRFRQSR